jgi:hypothetical protein
MSDIFETSSRAFAPEWISKDLELDIGDFKTPLSTLEIVMDDDVHGWVFDKCKKDFEILNSIVKKNPYREMR